MVLAFVQCQPNHIRSPDVTPFVLCLWQYHIVERIAGNNLPANRLLERTPHQLDDLFNGLVADIGGNGLSGLGRH